MKQMNPLRILCCALSLGVVMTLVGCKSHWIDATIENHTGQPIHELEVDYPSASFGTNTLAPGAAMHYRFQVRGEGPIKLEYIRPGGTVFHAQGLTLTEQQQGSLLIQLLPTDKVEFMPNLKPAS